MLRRRCIFFLSSHHAQSRVTANLFSTSGNRRTVGTATTKRKSLREETAERETIDCSPRIPRVKTILHLESSPVDSIRDALFPNRKRPIPSPIARDTPMETIDFSYLFRKVSGVDKTEQIQQLISRHVLTHLDGLRLVAAFPDFIRAMGYGEDVSMSRRILRTLNAILSRLHQLHIPIDRNMALYGIKCASRAGLAAALRHHLAILASLDDTLGIDDSLSVLDNLLSSIEQDSFDGWVGLRRKQELLTVATGWGNGNINKSAQNRYPSVYSSMRKDHLDIWSRYLDLVRKLSGKEAVFGQWLQIRTSPVFLEKASIPDLGEGARDPHSVSLRIGLVNIFVQNMVMANDPGRAWQIIYESKGILDVLDDSTWSLLLDYPEFIIDWQPEMAAPVLKKYEDHLLRIEKAMGLKWSGGEIGFHITLD
ncbi:hypothetical protein MMC24_006703 [Lignoscripta atroalba]|nr:hypothetical protein [Lignoscripta atroalba]